MRISSVVSLETKETMYIVNAYDFKYMNFTSETAEASEKKDAPLWSIISTKMSHKITL